METQLIVTIGVIAGFALISLATVAWKRDVGGIRTRIAGAFPGAAEKVSAGLDYARAFWAKYGGQLVGIVVGAVRARLQSGSVEVVDHDDEK